MAAAIHVSISAEPLFSVGGLVVSNSILTSLIVSGLLITFALLVRASLKTSGRPSGLQNFAEWVVESLEGLLQGITGSKTRTEKFLPLIATFFLFILLNNWLGLLPGVGTIGFTHEAGATEHAQLQPSGVAVTTPQAYASTPAADDHAVEATVVEPNAENGAEVHTESVNLEESHEAAAEEHHEVFVPYLRAGTADLNTTLALALISVFMTQFIGIQFQGLAYFKKFINFSSPIMFFVGILETISEFAKIVSFAFRLFGNIFAGEVLLVVISALTKVVAPIPFYGLEIFVGFIQALVFAMLSTVFFNMASHSHDEH